MYPSAAVTAPALLPTPPAATRDLRALLPDELTELGRRPRARPAYRAEQIFRWLHGQRRRVARRDDQRAARRCASAGRRSHQLRAADAATVQTARDGTRKLRFRTRDGRAIESVLIPDEDAARDKLTLCISSQVGCAIDCEFCATATLGLRAPPDAGEIVEQVYRAHRAGRAGRPTNLVFMGMGEPLHNFDNVVARARAAGAPLGRRLLAAADHGVDRRAWCPASTSWAR